MTDVESLRTELRRAYDGEPWHGPSLRALLTGVTAAEAAARPVAGAHTIWELVLHLRAWTAEVHRRTLGHAPGEPAEGDWPAVTATDDGAWERAQAALGEAHEALLARLADLPVEQLDSMIGPTRDAPLGTGVSVGATLHGLAQHHAYHGGQIALLKRALRG